MFCNSYKIQPSENDLFKNGPDVVKTEWQPSSWWTQRQVRVKVGATGDLNIQILERNYLYRAIKAVCKPLGLKVWKSLAQDLLDCRNLGHVSISSVKTSLSTDQKLTISHRQVERLIFLSNRLRDYVIEQQTRAKQWEYDSQKNSPADKDLQEILGTCDRILSSLKLDQGLDQNPEIIYTNLRSAEYLRTELISLIAKYSLRVNSQIQVQEETLQANSTPATIYTFQGENAKKNTIAEISQFQKNLEKFTTRLFKFIPPTAESFKHQILSLVSLHTDLDIKERERKILEVAAPKIHLRLNEIIDCIPEDFESLEVENIPSSILNFFISQEKSNFELLKKELVACTSLQEYSTWLAKAEKQGLAETLLRTACIQLKRGDLLQEGHKIIENLARKTPSFEKVKNYCLDLILAADAHSMHNYLAGWEAEEETLRNTSSSEKIRNMFGDYIKEIRLLPLGKWGIDSRQRNEQIEKFETIRKALHKVDRCEKAFRTAFEEMDKRILACREQKQLLHCEKLIKILNSQYKLVVGEASLCKTPKDMKAYRQVLKKAKRVLEDGMVDYEELSLVQQLEKVSPEGEYAKELRELVIEEARKNIENHVNDLKLSREMLEKCWQKTPKNLWHEDVLKQIDQMEKNIKFYSDWFILQEGFFFTSKKQVPVDQLDKQKIIEYTEFVNDTIENNLTILEYNTHVNELLEVESEYLAARNKIHDGLKDLLLRHQFVYANSLSDLLEIEEKVYDNLLKNQVDSKRVAALIEGLRKSINHFNNSVESIQAKDPLPPIEQLKKTDEITEDQAQILRNEFLQEVRNRIAQNKLDLQKKLTKVEDEIILARSELHLLDSEPKVNALDNLESLKANILTKIHELDEANSSFSFQTGFIWSSWKKVQVEEMTPKQLQMYASRVEEMINSTNNMIEE